MQKTRLKRGLASALLITALLTPTALAAENPAPTSYPLRSLAEAAGATVTWDDATTSATITLGAFQATVRIGESVAQVGNRQIELGAPVQLIDGKTMVPLSFFSEGLGMIAYYESTMAQQLRPAWAAPLEGFVQQIGLGGNCPGFAIGLAEQGKPLYLHGYGSRNCEAGLPMTSSTIMGIGSSTKSVTAVAILQLQDAGKLSVNDPVQKYLPEFNTNNPEWAKETTIHHLLTHSAGLPTVPALFFMMADSLKADPDAPPTLKELPPMNSPEALLSFLAASPQPLLGKPGTYFSYSNESFVLLGEIIARVSGQDYATYVTEHILKPAGMTNSTFSHEAMLQMAEYAELYNMVPNADMTGVEAQHSPVWWDTEVGRAAGFMRSTVQDMLRFSEIFRTGGLVGGTRILSEEAVKAMTTPYAEADPNVYYGYGLVIRPDFNGTKLVQHSGSNKGISSVFTVLPEKGITAVGLTNFGGAPMDLLTEGAINLAMGRPLYTPPNMQPVALSPEQLATLKGTYAGGEAAPFTFIAEDGQYFFEQAGMRIPAVAVSEYEFKVNINGTVLTMTFMRNEENQVFALRFGYRMMLKQ